MRNDIRLSKWQITSKADLNDDFIESVFFSGNGRMGARGYPSLEHGAPPYKTGLFVAGVFANLKSNITDFVNLPTPFYFSVKANGESPQSLPTKTEYSLDMHTGMQTFSYQLKFSCGSLDIKEERFFSLKHPDLAAERIKIVPSGDMNLEIFSGIKTDCCNFPINDDQTKENNETVNLISILNDTFSKTTQNNELLKHEIKTNGTDIKITETIIVKPFNAKIVDNSIKDNASGFIMASNAKAHEPIVIEKNAQIVTSRDVFRKSEQDTIEKSFEAILEESQDEWQKRWDDADIEIKGNSEIDAALRYIIFELIANDSANDPTVSIGARGLTHTRYKGCYFWDTDLFMMPFYLYTCPTAAKSLMEYRAKILPKAKEHAKKMNGEGARYPWMCSFDGSEQCESWDIGASEVHITADVAFAMNKYITAADDRDFYVNKAAEVYIETARFWVSRYSPEEGTGKVNLLFCKGPDEYCGITQNNLYTNFLVKENLLLAIEAARFLKANYPKKYQSLKLSEEETEDFARLENAIKIPKDEKTGHFKQDDTFEMLEPVNLKDIKDGDSASYHSICFDRVQRYRVIKQADVILLMTRFKDRFTDKERMAAWHDFEPVCLHDSTLSFATHALFAAENGINDAAMSYFYKSLFLDLRNIMGNTGTEGLHTACLGEIWQAVVFGFAGLCLDNDKIEFAPHLPDEIDEIDFCFYYHKVKYKAAVTKNGCNLKVIN